MSAGPRALHGLPGSDANQVGLHVFQHALDVPVMPKPLWATHP